VPYVFVVDAAAHIEIGLPVTNATELDFGATRISVLRTAAVAGDAAAPNPAYRTPALGVEVDFGTWHGERRVLLPERAMVDDRAVGVRMQRGIDCTAPEPSGHFELPINDAASARKLTLEGAWVQVRGPWRIRFALPEGIPA
jgi:hypothetical protein